MAGRVRRHVRPPVHGVVAEEPHGADHGPAVRRARVGMLLLDTEPALRRVAGGAGGDADDAPRLACLDDREDLPGLVDLDVRGRAREAHLDALGPVELAPARRVEDVGPRHAVRLAEGHHDVPDRGGEADAQPGDVELQALEPGEHPLDVRTAGAGLQRPRRQRDLGLHCAPGEPVRSRQGEGEREPVDAAERRPEDRLAVADADLVRPHRGLAVDHPQSHDPVVRGRRDLQHELGGEERHELPVGDAGLGFDGERSRRADHGGVGAGELGHERAATLRPEAGAVGAVRVRDSRGHLDAVEPDHDGLSLGRRLECAGHGHGVAEHDGGGREHGGEGGGDQLGGDLLDGTFGLLNEHKYFSHYCSAS